METLIMLVVMFGGWLVALGMLYAGAPPWLAILVGWVVDLVVTVLVGRAEGR